MLVISHAHRKFPTQPTKVIIRKNSNNCECVSTAMKLQICLKMIILYFLEVISSSLSVYTTLVLQFFRCLIRVSHFLTCQICMVK